MFTSSRKGAGGPSNLCDEMEHMHRTNFGEYFLDDDGGGIEDDSDAESDDDRLIAPMSDPPGDSGQPPQAHIRYDPQTLLPIYNAGSFNLWLHILDDSALDVLLEECLLREELHRALLRSSSSSRDFVVAACRRSMPEQPGVGGGSDSPESEDGAFWNAVDCMGAREVCRVISGT